MAWTALGLAFAAGQNPYAALFLLAVLARSDNVELTLQTPFTFLSHTAAIGALFVLTGAQVFADKHPRWGQWEAQVSIVMRPLCAIVIVFSLLDTAHASVWLWAVAAVAIALCSHFLRLRLRRMLVESMAGMGYFLASLMLDSAALIAGLLAILVPVVGALLGALMLGASAMLSLPLVVKSPEDGGSDSSS